VRSPDVSIDRPAGPVPAASSPAARRLRPAWLVVAALLIAAVSLLAPWSLAFDPWAWLVWGRDVTRGTLDTTGGPSWKPLPVVVTTVLAAAGTAAPALWLLLARAAGLLAVVGAHRLAGRLAGPVAAWTAVAAMALSEWWLFNTALGNSEGLLVATVLWAIVAHLAGRARAALGLGVAAGLLRPEAWPFLALYAAWLWRRGAERPAVLALALAPVPLLWLGPDVIAAGGALGASDAARGPASDESAVHADVPALEVVLDFGRLLTPPVAVAAIAGAVVGGRVARALAAAALAWVAIVAAMAQAGYAGNPRYNVVPAAVGCVLAGVGIAAAARALGAWAVATAAAVLLFTGSTLADQLGELDDRAHRRTDLAALIADVGGARAVRACARVRTSQPMSSMVAWSVDAPMANLAAPPRAPVAVLRAPRGYDREPPAPPAPSSAAAVATVGDWRLLAACAPGRTLPAGVERPSAAR